jgi:hypothetical protein
MEFTKTLPVAVLITVTALVGALCPVLIRDHPSTPLDDQSLSSIRGADQQFVSSSTTSCDAMGVLALSQVYGGSWNQQSSCGGMNIGFLCGGCTVTRFMPIGLQTGGLAPPNTPGFWNTDVGACGNVQGGTCGILNPNATPPTYGCLGTVVATNPANGQPYACSDLIALASQPVGSGGPQPIP